jgi:hypothetical protein
MAGAKRSALDRFFGGQAGAAEQALKKMQQTYGRTDGRKVFDGTIAKRKRREKRGRR